MGGCASCIRVILEAESDVKINGKITWRKRKKRCLSFKNI